MLLQNYHSDDRIHREGWPGEVGAYIRPLSRTQHCKAGRGGAGTAQALRSRTMNTSSVAWMNDGSAFTTHMKRRGQRANWIPGRERSPARGLL